MFLEDFHFPETISEVLSKQLHQRITTEVHHLDPWGQEDPAATGGGAFELDVFLLGGSLVLLVFACQRLARLGPPDREG